jgi:hypothetical protein
MTPAPVPPSGKSANCSASSAMRSQSAVVMSTGPYPGNSRKNAASLPLPTRVSEQLADCRDNGRDDQLQRRRAHLMVAIIDHSRCHDRPEVDRDHRRPNSARGVIRSTHQEILISRILTGREIFRTLAGPRATGSREDTAPLPSP